MRISLPRVISQYYLSEEELNILSRMVTAYLDLAESMAMRNIPMTMSDWEIRLADPL
ncbi:MAG: virulence RhuM family protein [Oribacterium sp.]|nr:virulence RhuM family protein [Oribacterium sp.]